MRFGDNVEIEFQQIAKEKQQQKMDGIEPLPEAEHIERSIEVPSS